MLALNHERVEYTRLDTDRDQLLVAESDMAARFPHRRSADGNLLPRPACRAGVPWDPGPFGQGLTHAQQGYDVPQGLYRPGAVGHPEQRLDACPHILPVVLPTPVKQPGVSEPRVHVRDEDVLYRDLELRDGVVVDRDVQPLAQLSLLRRLVALARKRGQMDQRLDPGGRRVILGPGQQCGERCRHQGEAKLLETPHHPSKPRGHTSDLPQLTGRGARHDRRGSFAVWVERFLSRRRLSSVPRPANGSRRTSGASGVQSCLFENLRCELERYFGLRPTRPVPACRFPRRTLHMPLSDDTPNRENDGPTHRATHHATRELTVRPNRDGPNWMKQ